MKKKKKKLGVSGVRVHETSLLRSSITHIACDGCYAIPAFYIMLSGFFYQWASRDERNFTGCPRNLRYIEILCTLEAYFVP